MSSSISHLGWRNFIPVFVLAAVGLLIILASPKPAAAAAFTNLSVTSSSSTPGGTSSWTLSFTTDTAIPASGGYINFGLMGPYSTGQADNYGSWVQTSLDSSTSPNTISIKTQNYNGLVLQTSQAIAAGTTVTVKINNVQNPLQEGDYPVHVWATTYSTDLVGTQITGGDYVSSYVRIGSAIVVGTIKDSAGTPVSNASVTLATSNYSPYYYGYTDVNGHYGIGGVKDGSYSVAIGAPYAWVRNKTYFPPTNGAITVSGGGAVGYNASFLAATKTVTGTVKKTNGSAVTDANVWFSKINGNAWVNVKTDSNGNYTASLPGGSFYVGIYPVDYSKADWTAPNSSETISFADDNSTESQTKDFSVAVLDAKINVTVTKPDGSAVAASAVSVNFSNSKGQWFWVSIDNNGKGTVSVVGNETYTASCYSSDSSYACPAIPSFSVGANGTKDLAITLVKKDKVIKGRVTDKSGAGVAEAGVYAWKNAGSYDWSNATADVNGYYSMNVTSGDWQVSAYPKWNSGYVFTGKAVAVTVGDAAAEVNFVFLKSTNTLTVKVRNPSTGTIIEDLSGWVGASDGSQPWSNIGNSLTKGVAELKLPAGKWTIKFSIWSGSFSAPDDQIVSFGDNETKELVVDAVKNSAKITGTIYNESKQAITGKYVSIWATKGSSWRQANFDTTKGTYDISLAPGTWTVGVWVDPATGLSAAGQDLQVTLAENESKNFDITLKETKGKITGTAKKADGTAMQWAWITADPCVKEKTEANYYSQTGTSSAADGSFTIKVPLGKYCVGGATYYTNSGIINPKRQEVNLTSGQPEANVELVFRKADGTISGSTKLGGETTSAYITAWGEDGAYAEANSSNNGNFSMGVTKGTKWHLKAVKEVGKDIYSKQVVIDLTDQAEVSITIELAKKKYTLPESTSVSFDPTQPQTITVSDGTTITIPANTLAKSGRVTLTVTPNAKLAEQDTAKPLAYGYDINATTDNGKAITTFANSEGITLSSVYSDEWLSDSKVASASEVELGYYDASSGTWIRIPECTANTKSSPTTVTCRITHLTTFSLIAASDTTPPDSPTDIKAVANNGIKLSWTNPKNADFKSITIYRSTKAGEQGDKLTSGLENTTSYADLNGLVKGTIYYYTVKAVDMSGNESINNAQVSAKSDISTKSILPKTGLPSTAWAVGIGFLILGLASLYARRKQLSH